MIYFFSINIEIQKVLEKWIKGVEIFGALCFICAVDISIIILKNKLLKICLTLKKKLYLESNG